MLIFGKINQYNLLTEARNHVTMHDVYLARECNCPDSPLAVDRQHYSRHIPELHLGSGAPGIRNLLHAREAIRRQLPWRETGKEPRRRWRVSSPCVCIDTDRRSSRTS